MKSTQKTTTKLSVRDTFLLPYVSALIAYSEKDSDFAESLAFHARELHSSTPIENDFKASNKIIITNRDEAIDIAHWVFAECDQSTPAVATALKTYAKRFDSPKDLLLGIVGLAIIGPTLGLISKKKRHSSHLQVFVDTNTATSLTPEKLAELTSSTGQSLLAKELKLAGGNITRLHPDSAEWLMSDPATKVQIVNQKILKDLATLIETENLSGLIRRDSKIINLVVISPAVPDTVIDDIS